MLSLRQPSLMPWAPTAGNWEANTITIVGETVSLVDTYLRFYMDDKGGFFVLHAVQDCRNNPLSCDPNASCVDSTFELIPDDPGTPMISERETRYYCQCNAGFVGNGFVCIVDGSISNSDRLLDLIEFL